MVFKLAENDSLILNESVFFLNTNKKWHKMSI